MDLLQQTKQLCQLYNIKPARSKGQNFLIQEDVYDKLIEAAWLTKDDIVLEVGPGLGFLTAKLAPKVKKVIAVELDDKLAKVLRIRLNAKGIKNVEVVNKNILNFEFPISNFEIIFNDLILKHSKFKIKTFNQSRNAMRDKIQNYKVVANLPYNITSIFLRKILSAEVKPILMVFMLQKEVAERITAKPGKMNLLAASVQFFANPEIIKNAPSNNFWPEPKVDSAIIKLRIKNKELRIKNKDFFRLLKIGFSAKRKMLKNNLSAGYHISQQEAEKKIEKAGFDPKIRAQVLSVNDWIKLFEEFKEGVV